MTAAASAARPRRRVLLLGAGLLTAVLVLVVARVLLGTPFVYADLAVRVLLGEDVPGVSFIVLDDRLPAALVGVLAGASFGLSGTVFQTLLRNPLASPDVIGVSLGSSAAAVFALAVLDAQGLTLFWWTLLGGLATALLVLWVARAHRAGGAGAGGAGAVDDRFVLVGIGVAAALTALIQYLLSRMPTQRAGDAMHWLVGSLSGATWPRLAVLAGALCVLVPLLALLLGRLRILQLGDDTATSLGLPVPATRIALVVVGVLLSALPVAVAGPLAFVAFLSGPIARMLAGRPSVPLAALVGAVLVLAADVAGQNLFGRIDLAAGVITGALGAPFLLWMLVRSAAGSGR
ncbi:iron ABC transporter permease [Brachybacterium sp. J144]|uniref:FecCD family ABC transporter permease n=1 Tax=Brachybacterium sp. J144 TaxID=3116487 RepID=UPI002E795447|nr:iron ABC transporter permease [Brachybacterium sp. J144]MEE1650856.1 iron ABC transporter permease [Brachybacterium sp. J144]